MLDSTRSSVLVRTNGMSRCEVLRPSTNAQMRGRKDRRDAAETSKSYIHGLLAPPLLPSYAQLQTVEIFLTTSHSPTAIMSSPYPTAYQIEEMFANRTATEVFNSYLADNVDVLVVGGEEFHVGGRYYSVQSFHDKVYGEISSAVKVETLKSEVLRVIGGGDSPWAAVESLTTATSKYGKSVSSEKGVSTLAREESI